jgi:phenylalanyl-tRNA synthetase beta chain
VVAAAAGAPLDVCRGDLPPFHPGRCAQLVVTGDRVPGGAAVVGHAGELHPRVIAALGLPPRTVAMELDLDAVLAAGSEVASAPAVGTRPLAKEDLAVVVPVDVPAAEVAAALRDGAGPLLEDIRLFDVYTGGQVPEGHRSLAFALRLRAPDRTLSAEETAEVRAAALAEAARRVGAVLRGA